MSRIKNIVILFLLFVSINWNSYSQLLPAFPGAQGFGANTPGGRGGRIIRVTNLKDSGKGSFRAALEELPAFTNEPRIIVFDVGGVIEGEYTKSIFVKYPFCTIAGQTAPGDGICLRGSDLIIGTHDVVIRGLRVRPGDNGENWTPPQGTKNFDGPDGITISTRLGLGDIYNVIVDHCSISWSTDENCSAWAQTKNPGKIFDITYQWNIISEGMACAKIHIENSEIQCHSTGLLIGFGVKNVSLHHNLFAHNDSRNARLTSTQNTEFINNVIYNWKHESTSVGRNAVENLPSFIDIINNYYKPGLSYKHSQTPDPEKNSFWEILVADNIHPDSRIFIKGNIGKNRPNDNMDEWALVKTKKVIENKNTGAKEIFVFKSDNRLVENDKIVVPIEATHIAKQKVLDLAGALSPKRDATDQRILNSFKNGTGESLNRLSEVGGYPVYATTYQTDSDTDGDAIPDWFEVKFGLNKKKNDANNTGLSKKFTGVEGYSNIEVYLNYLIDIYVPVK